MASHAENNIDFYLSIPSDQISDLASIRPWTNLQLAYDTDLIWIKGLNYVQANSVEVKSLPLKTVYAARGAKLFLQGSELPHCNIPSVLWTPIQRALPLKILNYNHNYFGINETQSFNIVPTENEIESTFLLVDTSILNTYLDTAPAIRFKNLTWTFLNDDLALIQGIPILPIDGITYWRYHDFLFPSGYQIDLLILVEELNDLLNPDHNCWVIWSTDSTYSLIDKSAFVALSRSSFSITLQSFSKI